MAFRMRCINQRIRACRSVGDFLQTPAITHTDRRVQSATTVTTSRVDHGVSVNHLEKISQQTANPKDPFIKGNYFEDFRNFIDPKSPYGNDLIIKNRIKKVDHKKFVPHKEVCDAHDYLHVNNVLGNVEHKLGLQSHWMHKNIHIYNAVPQETNILFSAPGGTGGTPSNSDFEKDRQKREEHLIMMKDFLEKSLPPIFEIGISYDAYSPNIVLENSYSGKKKVVLGLQNYKIEVYKLRGFTAIRFIHTRMCVLSTSCDLDENCVRVRWRILGLKQSTALLRLHVYGKFWKVSKIPDRELEKDAVWYDGISYYYLNDEGLVNRHVITRVEEDSSRTVNPSVSMKERLTGKLGVLSSKQI